MRYGNKIQCRNTGKIRTEAGEFAIPHVEQAADARLSQVGVDKHGAVSKLRQCDGQISRGGGLAFAGERAGYEDDLRGPAWLGEQKRSAQRTERFGHLGIRKVLGNELNSFFMTIGGDA